MAVEQLGHHPSIALWSAHNEPADTSIVPATDWRARLRDVAAQQLPTWNKTVLDRWVKRAFERNDPSRPTDRPLGRAAAPPAARRDRQPPVVRVATGRSRATSSASLGDCRVRSASSASSAATVVPTTAPVHRRTAGAAPLARPRLGCASPSEYGYQRELIESQFPPADFATFDDWRSTLQLYQSYVLHVQIETLRRLKYRPTGGFCFSALADPAPNVSASVLDHERVPKDAYATVQAACAPVIVVADLPPDWVNPGDTLRLDVHIVNDRRAPIDDARGRCHRHAGPAVDRSWAFGGPVDADDVVKVGVIELTVPDTLGELAIELVAIEADGTPLATQPLHHCGHAPTRLTYALRSTRPAIDRRRQRRESALRFLNFDLR